MDLWPGLQHQVQTLSCEAVFWSNQTAVGYPIAFMPLLHQCLYLTWSVQGLSLSTRSHSVALTCLNFLGSKDPPVLVSWVVETVCACHQTQLWDAPSGVSQPSEWWDYSLFVISSPLAFCSEGIKWTCSNHETFGDIGYSLQNGALQAHSLT